MTTIFILAFVLAFQTADVPSAATDIIGPPDTVIEGAYLPRISPDGRTLAYATTFVSEDVVALQVMLRDLRTGESHPFSVQALARARRHAGSAPSGLLWADARRLRIDVAMCDGGTTYVIDARSGRLLRSVDSERSGPVPDTYQPGTRILFRSRVSTLTLRFGGSNTVSNNLIPAGPSTLTTCVGGECEDVSGLDDLLGSERGPSRSVSRRQ